MFRFCVGLAGFWWVISLALAQDGLPLTVADIFAMLAAGTLFVAAVGDKK